MYLCFVLLPCKHSRRDKITMVVSDSKVSLGNRYSTMCTKAKLDTGLSTSRVRTDQFIAMLYVRRDYKMRSLSRETDQVRIFAQASEGNITCGVTYFKIVARRHAACTTRNFRSPVLQRGALSIVWGHIMLSSERPTC